MCRTDADREQSEEQTRTSRWKLESGRTKHEGCKQTSIEEGDKASESADLDTPGPGGPPRDTGAAAAEPPGLSLSKALKLLAVRSRVVGPLPSSSHEAIRRHTSRKLPEAGANSAPPSVYMSLCCICCSTAECVCVCACMSLLCRHETKLKVQSDSLCCCSLNLHFLYMPTGGDSATYNRFGAEGNTSCGT